MFTKAQLEALPTTGQPYRVWEGGGTGFGLQVSGGGVKTFFMLYHWRGRRTFLGLGRLRSGRTLADIGLLDARRKAREARDLLDRGINPKDHWRALVEEAEQARLADEQRRREEAARGSVKQLFDVYLTSLEAAGKSSAAEVRRSLERDALPVLGPRTKAMDVAPGDIRAVLHRIIKRGAPIQANRLRSYLSAAFSFGLTYDNDPHHVGAGLAFALRSNPVRDVPKAIRREAPGERDLSPDELRAVWRALSTRQTSPVHALALKFILATAGQRMLQVLRAEWRHIDLERAIWDVSRALMKNGRAHVVPLNRLALEVLEELKPFTGAGPLLFPKEGAIGEPVPKASLSQTVRRVCRIEAARAEEAGCEPSFRRFTPRDLRRTVKTRAGEIGLSKEIRDRLQGHVPSDVSSKHYDRYDYFEEKRQAAQRWGDYLEGLLAVKKPCSPTSESAMVDSSQANARGRKRI